MSAITFVTVKERPITERPRVTRPRREVNEEPITITRAQTRKNPLGAEFFLSQAFLFATVLVVTYGFSILMGNSVMEYARRSKIRSLEAATTARTDTAAIRGRLDRLAATAEVREWAVSRGFVASHSLDGGAVSAKPTIQ